MLYDVGLLQAESSALLGFNDADEALLPKGQFPTNNGDGRPREIAYRVIGRLSIREILPNFFRVEVTADTFWDQV